MVKHKQQVYHNRNQPQQDIEYETKMFEFNGIEFELIFQALFEKRRDLTKKYEIMMADNVPAPTTNELIALYTDLIHKLEARG